MNQTGGKAGRIGAAILIIVVVFTLAAVMRHATHDCARISGTTYCK